MFSLTLPDLSEAPWLGAVVSVLSVAWIANRLSASRSHRRNPRRLPPPPGPKGLPFLGNIFQLPSSEPWKGYAELFEEYGDMVYLEALGQPILMLGSLSHSVDLLEKRSVIYSDRPPVPIVDLMSVDWAFPIMEYGPRWRQHRQVFHDHFSHSAVRQYHPIMDEERLNVLRKIRDDPCHFLEHTKMFFGTVIMRTTYGFDDLDFNQKLVRDAEEVTRAFGEAVIPGKFLVNAFPIMKYIPEWVPGASFKTHFKRVALLSNNVLNSPFEGVKQKTTSGQRSAYPSLAASLIDGLPEEGDPDRCKSEAVARNVCGVAYLAGADSASTAGAAIIFVLATYPEVQKKGRAELNSVVGWDRLPNISDRAALPYIQAIVKEVSRWYTASPLGLAHFSSEDDEYDGYFIPKGTTVITNAWAISHDPDIFENPFEFIPERYLKDGKIDPSIPEAPGAFGFGRRICPGRHFSNDAMFLFTASLLSAFDFSPPKDDAGNPVEITLDTNEYFIARPRPYKCDITLRPDHKSLLN